MIPVRYRLAVCCAIPLAALIVIEHSSLVAVQNQPKPASALSADEQQARVTCGGCHAFPPPEILPRGAWRDEFVRMLFIRENRLPPPGPPEKVLRGVKLPPVMEQVLPFYTSRAPERLPASEPWPRVSPRPVARSGLSMPDMPATPAVSNVQLVDLNGDKRLDVLGTDMRQGLVSGTPGSSGAELSVVANPHPARDPDGRGR
jgi:hypothetical protein